MGYYDKLRETTNFKFLIKPRSPKWAHFTWYSSSESSLVFQTDGGFEAPMPVVRTAIHLHLCVSHILCLSGLWVWALEPGSLVSKPCSTTSLSLRPPGLPLCFYKTGAGIIHPSEQGFSTTTLLPFGVTVCYWMGCPMYAGCFADPWPTRCQNAL